MRRTLLIATLLAASHGTALWLGWQRQSAAPLAASQVKPEATAPAQGVASLVEKGRALAAKERAEEDRDFDALVDAARGKFPAGADLRAILEKGVVNPNADFSAETVAAFSTWMERDPAAALHWFSGFLREYGQSEFDFELKRHFQRAGAASLQAWITAEPQIRSSLIEYAAASFEEQDGSRALQVMASLTSPADRVAFLMDCDVSLTGQLASIRALLDRSGAYEFLDSIATQSHAGLLDEARGAGFPEGALRRFEEEVQKEPVGKDGRNNIDAVLNNPNRTQGEVPVQIQTLENVDWTNISPYRTNSDFPAFGEPVPLFSGSPEFERELRTKRDLLDDGRLTMAEFAEWVGASAPPGPNREQGVLGLITGMALEGNPRAALDYVQKADPEGWAEIVATRTRWAELPPELLAELARQIPETDPTGPVHIGLLNSYEKWYQSDPQACMEAVQAYPSGPLKDRLLKIGMKEEEAE